MKPDTLILGPGGSNGFYELGSLLYLEKEGYINDIKTYVGVSIGSLISLLHIVGYTIEEIIGIATEHSFFEKIEDFSFASIRDGIGILSADVFKSKLGEHIRKKLGFLPTLKNLFLATGVKLVCVTLNINTNETEYISYENNPDILSNEAVGLSCNIPFIFQKIAYNGCTYIDGGFADPYPIKYADTGKNNICIVTIEQHFTNNNEGILDYIMKVIHAPIIQLVKRSQQYMNDNIPEDRLLSLSIPSDDFDPVGVSQGIDKKAKMVLNGYQIAKDVISKLSQKEIKTS